MKKTSLLLIASLFFSITLNAQNEVDALRYSELNLGGTARFISLGGAFSALGADFSTLSTNPAGIGLYKKSEFSFSPSFYRGKTESDFYNNITEDSKFIFNVSNIGVVFPFFLQNKFSKEERSGWKFAQFGFGLNRQNNFNNRMIMESSNHHNSLLTQYLDFADGINYQNLNPFDTEMAFNTYLLDTLGGSSSYISAVPNGGVEQRKVITMSGSMNEFVFTLGGNYNDRLYIGGTLGLPFFSYTETSTYSEFDNADTITDFDAFELHEELTTRGSGINFKFGLIFRASNWVRIGAAFHTPTNYYKVEDDWNKTMKSFWDDGTVLNTESPKGKFDYSLTTPMRVIGSIAFIFGKAGLISADYEYADYAEAKLRSDDYGFVDENQAIRDKYTAQHNIKIGTEWRLDPITVRGGYAVYGTPFKSGINDGKRSSVSFGLGLRQRNFFIDLAYVYTHETEDYYLYSSNYVNPAENNITSGNFLITFGFKGD